MSDATFTKIGISLAHRSLHPIYWDGKCPCLKGPTLHLLACEVSLLIGMDILFNGSGVMGRYDRGQKFNIFLKASFSYHAVIFLSDFGKG